MDLIFIGFIWVVCGLVCAFIASEKKRNVGGWLVIGLVFGLLGLVAIAAVPSIEEAK